MASLLSRESAPTFAAGRSALDAAQPFMSEELTNERTQIFTEFLDSQRCSSDGLEYREKVRSMLRRGDSRLIVVMADIRSFNAIYAKGLLNEPMAFIEAFDKALKNIIDALMEIDLPFEDMSKVFFHIGLEGAFGEHHTTPRNLSSRLLGKLICLEGIVTSCFLVRPKLVKSVHYVEETGLFLSREYRDATMGQSMPQSNAYPTQDAEGHALSTEYGFCVYRDSQKIVIQEMPERAPAGQMPRSLEVLLSDDLVDRAKPGDRVQIVGCYKALAYVANGQVPSNFRTVILANAVRPIGKEASQSHTTLTDVDVAHIKEMSNRADLFDLMGSSLAPSIYGHPYIKKAILLMLLGGIEKNLEHTHLRGDINILMVGDPSTAKSQLLRFILHMAPLAIATTGRGSSGVGLTAAVTTDKETGERRLEAGAMVLADRGVVCIDEFDKMSDVDRVAIHEVMEQQTVTIAKAGIHLSLNARCSVIAAANPVWSQYRESATPQENIRLPDSLLSRFDLLFIVLDTMNPEIDRHISHHVLNMHRYVNEGNNQDGPGSLAAFLEDDDDREKIETPIFQKHMEEDILTVAFVKKYIQYAKLRIKPVLTQVAAEAIRRLYNEFRAKKEEDDNCEAKTLPVTPRTLETLIRLSTAHAKLRLSSIVEHVDVAVAEELTRYSLYKEVIAKKSTLKKRRTVKDDQVTEALSTMTVEDEFEFSETVSTRRSTRVEKSTLEPSQIDMNQSQDSEISSVINKIIPSQAQIISVKQALSSLRNENPDETIFSAMDVMSRISMDRSIVDAVLDQMQEENMLMYRDGTIILL